MEPCWCQAASLKCFRCGPWLLHFPHLGAFCWDSSFWGCVFWQARGSCCSTFVHVGALFSSRGGHQALSSVVTLGWGAGPKNLTSWPPVVSAGSCFHRKGVDYTPDFSARLYCTFLGWPVPSLCPFPVSLVAGKLLCAAAHSSRGPLLPFSVMPMGGRQRSILRGGYSGSGS